MPPQAIEHGLPDSCRRARCEDRIRNAKDTGLRNLPLHACDQSQNWCQIVALACDLLAWTAMLALTGPARRWEPNACGSVCSLPPGGSSAAAAASEAVELYLEEVDDPAGHVTATPLVTSFQLPAA